MRKSCVYVVYGLCVGSGISHPFMHTLKASRTNVGTTPWSYTKLVQLLCTHFPLMKSIIYRGE